MQAAAGGIGSALVHLARAAGKRVVAVAGSKEKAGLFEHVAALLGMLSDGTIRPSIQECVPLAEAARAQALLESGGVLGQLVLKP